MSHEDPYRNDRGPDRGAYTPPTDHDLHLRRGGYDPRGGGGGGGGGRPPLTLLISAGVLFLLILAVVLYYGAGPKASKDAPPAVGQEVGALKVEPSEARQPVDPAADIAVYDEAEPIVTAPTYVEPEAVQPRPAEVKAPPPAVAPAPREAAPAVGGNVSVQIGAFSTPGLADSAYDRIVGRHARFTEGAGKRVQEVTTSSGSTVYRTLVTGLSREQATGLCDAIKAAGGDCMLR